MPKHLIFLFSILWLLIPLIGAGFVSVQTRQIEQSEYKNLQNIAQLKAGQIEIWLKEREGDCRTLFKSKHLASVIEQMLAQPGDDKLTKDISEQFALIKAAYGYDSLLLLDRQARLLLSTGNDTDLPKDSQALLLRSMNLASPLRGDLYRSLSGRVNMDWIVPIIPQGSADGRPVAAILLRTEPEQFFYPLRQTWPESSASAETLMVRKEGDFVVYLNNLRYQDNAALNLRLPLSTPGLPSAAALQTDRAGTAKGVDYRGMTDLAAFRPVAGTSWRIVSRIDQAEVFALMWQTLQWFVAIAGAALLSVTLAFRRLSLHQQRLKALEAQTARARINQQIQSLGDNLPNGFVYQNEWTPDGRKCLKYISAGVEKLLGLTPGQVLADANLLFAHAESECLHAFLQEEAVSAQTLGALSGLLQFKRPNSPPQWLRIQAQPHRLPEGGIVWDGLAIDVTEQHLAALKIEASEERFRKLFEASSQALLLMENGRFIACNRAVLRMMGLENLAELTGKLPEELSPEFQPDGRTSQEKATECIRMAFEKGHNRFEWVHVKNDGSPFLVEVNLTPVFLGGKPILFIEWVDITERRRNELRSERLKKLYENLTQINEKILHSTDEPTLLNELCRIPVDSGLMNMAWVGKEETGTQSILPVVRHGASSEYLDDIRISTNAELPEGQGVTGTVWREQKPLVNNDTANNPIMAPWRGFALRNQLNSSACFPIFRNGKIYAVFTAYNTECHFFDDQVMALLNAMVNDVSFALDGLDAKQNLKASEEHSRLLLESANSGIYGLDIEGRATFVNPMAAAMLGYAPEELMGKPMHAISHHSRLDGSPYPAEECPIYATFLDGQPRKISHEVFWRKDGSSFPVEYTTHPIRHEGTLLGIVVVVLDITDRVRVQEQLVRREEIFRAIVSQASDAICLVDALGFNFVEFNEASCLSLGYSRDEFADLKLPDIQGEFDSDTLQALVRQYSRAGGTHFETLLRRKDGELRNVDVRMHALDLQGQRYLSLMWTDITGQVRMQAQLSKEREHLQNIIEGTHAGTWEWNLATGEAIFNERWAEMFGYRLADLEPMQIATWERFVHPDDLMRSKQLLDEHLSGASDYYECDMRMRHKAGRWIWIANRGRTIRRTDDGKPLIVSGTNLDITQRREAEERLRQSEERFRKLFEDSKQPLMLFEEGRIIDANPAALEMTGFQSLQALRGVNPGQLSPEYQPDGRLSSVKLAQMIQMAMEQGSHRFEWEHLHKDGGHCFSEILLTPITIDGRTLIHAAWTDISERRRLEIQMVQFAAIVNSSDDAIISKSMDGLITSWNPGAENIFGYSAEEMIGNSMERLLPPERQNEEDSILKRIKLGMSVEHFETQRLRKDGTLIDISATTSPIHDTHGHVIGASKIARDITERKKIEQQVRKLSLSVEQSLNSVIITDLDASIEYVNPRFTEISGYSREEVLGKNPRLLQSQHTPKSVYDDLWATLKQGKNWRGEFVNRRKDGSEFYERAQISPLRDEQGRTTHYVSVKEDITEKKRTDKELDNYRLHLEQLVHTRTIELETAKLQAEAANRSKSNFLANMSHEIRTPLNAIIGFAHLLRPQTRSPDQKDKLDKIVASGKHLLGIINDILDLSKIEAEKLTLEENTFLVASTLDHVRSMMADRLSNKGLSLTEEIDPELSAYPVVGDPLRLGQVLVNLIGNAVKFTERGGIVLRARLVSQTAERVNLRFEVQDSGIGIDKKHQNKLFAAFEQAESSTTRKYGGTGLGLAISGQLVRLMEGEIGVSSQLGQGSTFWFTASLKRSTAKQMAQEEKLPTSWELRPSARILLVEDNEINQEVAREILENMGLVVETANHGGEAIERLKTGAYDLVLMDMQMPVMDGLETTRLLRNMPAFKKLPILAMTANAFEEDRRRCEAAGMDGFVAKPVEPDRLRANLARWIPAETTKTEAPKPTTPAQEIAAPGEAFPSWVKHIDMQTGASHFGNGTSSYYRLLSQFAASHLDDAAKLRASLHKGETPSARRTAHTLKGVAATLGMDKVRQIAFMLDHAMQKGTERADMEANISSLEAELLAVCKEIEHLHLESQVEAPIESQPERFNELLVRLDAQLAEDDISVTETWSEILPSLRTVLEAGDLAQLRQLIENFDYPGALETLRSLFEELQTD